MQASLISDIQHLFGYVWVTRAVEVCCKKNLVLEFLKQKPKKSQFLGFFTFLEKKL